MPLWADTVQLGELNIHRDVLLPTYNNKNEQISLRDLCCLPEPSKLSDHFRGNRCHSKHPLLSPYLKRKKASNIDSLMDLTRLLFWLRFYQNSPLQRTGSLSRVYERCVLLRSDYIILSFGLDIQEDSPQVKKEDKARGTIHGLSPRCQFSDITSPPRAFMSCPCQILFFKVSFIECI